MAGKDGRLLRLYEELLEQSGPQECNKAWPRNEKRAGVAWAKPCWWPADSRFEVVVGALLAQNTNWKNVEKAIGNLKDADSLDAERIVSMRKCSLEKLIRPSGFYRQKAKRLKTLAKSFLVFESRGSPPSRDELLAIDGVGKETADSILLYAYDIPHFVIDAYTRRFCKCHSLLESKEYDDYKSYFERALPRDVALYKEYHALIVEWGKAAGRMKRAD